MILAIDPGRKPGYVLLDTLTLVERRHLPHHPRLPLVAGAWPALPETLGRGWVDRVVVEGQWLTGPQKKRAVLSLAIIAGWQLCRAVEHFGGTPQVLLVDDWRDALECGGTTKRVMQRRTERSLLPAEVHLLGCASASRLGDLLDAIALGWAAWLKPSDWRIPS